MAGDQGKTSNLNGLQHVSNIQKKIVYYSENDVKKTHHKNNTNTLQFDTYFPMISQGVKEASVDQKSRMRAIPMPKT